MYPWLAPVHLYMCAKHKRVGWRGVGGQQGQRKDGSSGGELMTTYTVGFDNFTLYLDNAGTVR